MYQVCFASLGKTRQGKLLPPHALVGALIDSCIVFQQRNFDLWSELTEGAD
jgi:hypothetical protein